MVLVAKAEMPQVISNRCFPADQRLATHTITIR